MAQWQIIKPATLVATVTLVLAACGSDGASESVQAETTVAAVAATPPTDGGEGQAPDDLAMVEERSPGDTSFSGEGSEAWCQELGDVAISPGGNPLSMEVFGLSPAEMEAQYTANSEVFSRMEAVASPEIDEAVSDVAAVFETFLTMGAAAGWDLDAMIADPEFMAAFDVVSLQTAVSEIERYTLEVCGLDLSS